MTVKDPIIKRLGDRRWYFLRNLLIILRHLNDPSVLRYLYGLFEYPHPRVRQELLHTLMTFGDPKADGMLLTEMSSSDMDRRLKAIMLAGMARNKEVVQKLIEFLGKKGMNKADFEIKKASVRALGEIGDTSVFHVLEGILKSFSLFTRRRSTLLKLEIVESLGKYPAAEAFSILKKIAGKRSGALAEKAVLTLKTMKVD